MVIDRKWLKSQFPDLQDLAQIGQGGQKVVFSARHRTMGAVVLKLIRPTVKDSAVSRELEAVRLVDSPRVPKILEHGTIPSQVGDCLWLIEPHILGVTLRSRLSSGPLHGTDTARLALHMLEALSKAEAVKIVHRDVKPDNIMCDRLSDYWLLDFGIARHLDLPSLTDTSARFGKFTPGYAPPEQFRNLKDVIDNRSDLFALGVTLYESVTGLNPFRENASNELDVLKRVETQALARLDTTVIDPKLADLIQALTQRRRDHRPESAIDALRWVRDILGVVEN